MTFDDPVLRFRPPRIALGLVLGAATVHLVMPLNLHRPVPWLAVIALLSGLFVMLRAWWLFRRAATAICPTSPTSTLIETDVYALTRNPMYLGMGLMLAAPALYTGDLAFYVACGAAVGIIARHFIPHEEAALQEQFGDRFSRYRSRVRRWL